MMLSITYLLLHYVPYVPTRKKRGAFQRKAANGRSGSERQFCRIGDRFRLILIEGRFVQGGLVPSPTGHGHPAVRPTRQSNQP
ncbi:hypothetical protein [Frankia sp. CcWB3]